MNLCPYCKGSTFEYLTVEEEMQDCYDYKQHFFRHYYRCVSCHKMVKSEIAITNGWLRVSPSTAEQITLSITGSDVKAAEPRLENA